MIQRIATYEGSAMFRDRYVYVTAKTMWVEPGNPGNRPGWHIDGWGSDDDINYTWCNMNPTQFAVQDFFGISTDDTTSMLDMAEQVDSSCIYTPIDECLLRLTNDMVHRVDPYPDPGYRTFIKVTLSNHIFRNAGNSVNHDLQYNWDIRPRKNTRNLDHA